MSAFEKDEFPLLAGNSLMPLGYSLKGCHRPNVVIRPAKSPTSGICYKPTVQPRPFSNHFSKVLYSTSGSTGFEIKSSIPASKH